MLRYALTDTPPVRPKRLRFNLLSTEEIERMSVCKITETTLYYRGLPATGSLLDPLMGSIDRRHLCATCMRDARTCPGHAGHIELAYPVYHWHVETVPVLRTMLTAGAGATDEDAEQMRAQPHGRQRLAFSTPRCAASAPARTAA